MYLFFLFLIQNIDCEYSLEPPYRGGSNVYPCSIFWAKMLKIIKIFLVKYSIFTAQYIAWPCFHNLNADCVFRLIVLNVIWTFSAKADTK